MKLSKKTLMLLGLSGVFATYSATSFSGCSSSNNPTPTSNPGVTPGASPSPTASASPGPVAAATGANLMCTSSGQNAYTTYGQAAFFAVNASIFTNVVNAGATTSTTTPLGSAFTLVGSGNPPSTADNLPTFEGNLAAFLVYLYGGPSQITYTDGVVYQGPQSMQDSHQGLNITASQYNYFVNSIVVPALTSNGVPSGDISSCFAPPLLDPTFMASIVGQ